MSVSLSTTASLSVVVINLSTCHHASINMVLTVLIFYFLGILVQWSVQLFKGVAGLIDVL